ncbi:MAG: DNA-deoxyinosine glycosylase [Woeseiaceae bacterium]|nr:DNA-deoxyinosine glycosylase [Woeseiaceae bacterium]
MARSEGFPPVARDDARILILGSLPGARSIAEQQYYAHPQNAFWRIMAELFGIEGDYAARCRQLCEHGIALWDVLQSSVRRGSMDAAIRLNSAQPNDFETFFAEHPTIGTIGFNGGKSRQLFARFVGQGPRDALLVQLPSTSPAYASMPFSVKLERWREALNTTTRMRRGL